MRRVKMGSLKKIFVLIGILSIIFGLGRKSFAGDIIIDDKDSGFEKQGSWFGEKSVGYRNHMYFTYTNGNC